MNTRSKISKKVFNVILGLEMIVVIAILFLVIADVNSKSFGTSTIIGVVTLIIYGMIVVPFIGMPLLIKAFQSMEISEKSERCVKCCLSEQNYVEVVPIKDRTEHKNFLTRELVKRAKFYAHISSDGIVEIFIKFNGEKNMIYYDKLHAGDFTSYFRIVKE